MELFIFGRKFKFSISVMLLGFLGAGAQNYEVSPQIPDFTDIHSKCVVATYGTTSDPFAFQGLAPGRHEVIDRQGKDYFTGNGLSLLPPGESQVIRLGNEQVHSEAESITYHFIVDSSKSVLLLKFAVVFQNPLNHTSSQQPRFVVRIMDKDGNLIDGCAEYDVSARPGIEGFNTCDYFGVPVRWRDWTSVGLDMSAFAGKEVQVQFVTYDCSLNGHFGYAYFTASCISHTLEITGCSGREFTVNAPGGFASYQWQSGEQTAEVTKEQIGEEMELSCEIVSATGCRFTLSAHILDDPVVPAERVLYDTICEGEEYHRNNYNLPAQTAIGTFAYPNTWFSLADCKEAGEVTLYLTILQRYYPIEVELCPGESYVENGFSYIKPETGEYRDSLFYPSASGRCDSIVVLHLVVFPEITMSQGIAGEGFPCVGTQQIYSISESWEEGQYAWEFPNGFEILWGQGTAQVQVQVTDMAQTGQVNLRFGSGACASGIEPFVIKPHKAYWQTVTDTICTGSEYHDNGFNIPIQDKSGFYIFSRNDKTTQGCDSVVSLNLYVFETPQVQINVTDSVICSGDQVQLQAWAGKTDFVVAAPVVAIGDIYCSDGSIVKRTDFRKSGKQAVGVVFYVNATGRHGWVVHIKNQSVRCRWGSESRSVPGLPRCPDYITSRRDTAGYENTLKIRKSGVAGSFGAAHLVDFEQGWYVPAIGQLLCMYGYVDELNAILKEVGGDPFVFSDNVWFYWSSTERTLSSVWGLEMKGRQMYASKMYTNVRLRAVRSF